MDSLNQAIDYFLDSLMGRSPHTKEAYHRDLLQFKLFLVLQRPHLISKGAPARRARLRAELERTGGRLHAAAPGGSSPLALLDGFDCALSALQREDVLAYFGFLESERRLSRNTLSRRASSLRQFCRMLVKEGYPLSPTVLEKLEDVSIRGERKVPIFLEEDEAAALLAGIDRPRDRAMVAIMLFMGLRISEVISLNWEDIEAESTEITFRGKGNKERHVPVHPSARAAVLAYKAATDSPGAADGLGVPLFLSNRKRRIDASTVRRALKQYAQRIGPALQAVKRRRLSPHKLRHTFATLLLQADVDIRYIQELLGHENLSTTQIYTTVRREDLQAAVRRHPLGAMATEAARTHPESGAAPPLTRGRSGTNST